MTFERCKACVMPNTRPDTPFTDGVCSACLSYANRPTINWEQRQQMLADLLAANKDKGPYDCVVPSSGGKDSTYQVSKLLEMGARVLIVTATTCYLTPIGRKNIDNLSRLAPTIEWTNNKCTRKKLNRLGLTLLGDISWPEHVSIFTTPFRVAEALGIPLIFYGENPQDQYGGPPGTEAALELTRRWRSEFGGFLGMRPSDFIGVEGITAHDMAEYELPKACTARAYFLGQFMPWDSHRNAADARANGMFQMKPGPANFWHHENLDNAMTGLHDHLMYRKFGFGRGCQQASVDVRTGRVQRPAAMNWVQFHDGVFPWEYMGVNVWDVLDQIEITKEAFYDAIEKHTNFELFDGQRDCRPILWEFAEYFKQGAGHATDTPNPDQPATSR